MSPLQASELGKDLARRDRFMNLLGITQVKTGPGNATLRMPVLADHLNFNATCHGGAIFSLADSALGLASNSHGILAAGIDAHVTYQAGVFEGDVLTATAQEVTRSRKIAVYRIEVTGKTGEIVSCFTGTVYITGKPNRSIPEI